MALFFEKAIFFTCNDNSSPDRAKVSKPTSMKAAAPKRPEAAMTPAKPNSSKGLNAIALFGGSDFFQTVINRHTGLITFDSEDMWYCRPAKASLTLE